LGGFENLSERLINVWTKIIVWDINVEHGLISLHPFTQVSKSLHSDHTGWEVEWLEDLILLENPPQALHSFRSNPITIKSLIRLEWDGDNGAVTLEYLEERSSTIRSHIIGGEINVNDGLVFSESISKVLYTLIPKGVLIEIEIGEVIIVGD
jgi:hypothetical protein